MNIDVIEHPNVPHQIRDAAENMIRSIRSVSEMSTVQATRYAAKITAAPMYAWHRKYMLSA